VEPKQQGIIRWSAHRAHDHLQAVVPASIGIPLIAIIAGQFIALPKKPTTADRIIQGVESLGVGVLIVALLVFIYAILIAPYEQRNALRRQLKNSVRELSEIRSSVHQTLRLDKVEITRNVPLGASPWIYDRLQFAMYFENTAAVPIKYSMQRLSLELNGQPVNIEANRDTYRLAVGGRDRYHFDLNLDPPLGAEAVCILDYCAWYGPSTDPYIYEQEYRMRCTSTPTLDPKTSNYRSTRLQGGKDILREQH
jgi:hypothetical protein